MYDSRIARWMSVDPKHQCNSPYVGMGDNPISGVDKDGGSVNPIYDPSNGALLGTDDRGIQGEALFMTKATFNELGGQGISHEVAAANNSGFGSLSASAIPNFFNNPFAGYNNISARPDWSGHITDEEAEKWYRNGQGLPLFTDIQKTDLSSLHPTMFENAKKITTLNLFFHSNSKDDGRVYGNLTFRLHPNNMVKAFPDEYDFDQKNWLNPLNFPRNIATFMGSIKVGHGTPFKIYIYGSQKIN